MTSDGSKPSIFIASSKESIEFAHAARSLLTKDKDIRATLWDEGIFIHGKTFIETLVDSRDRFDFCLVILGSDDLLTSRGVESFAARDNVIFELGLFMGHLGRGRTFIIHQDDVRIPSDLAGLVTATFEWPSEKRGTKLSFKGACEAIGALCDPIREAMRDLGVAPTRANKQLGQVQQRQTALESRVRALQIVIKGIVTEFERDKLEYLNMDAPFLVRYSNDMYEELKRLDAIRYIQPRSGCGIIDIQRHAAGGEEFDLKQYIYITDDGIEYLNLRAELMQAA